MAARPRARLLPTQGVEDFGNLGTQGLAPMNELNANDNGDREQFSIAVFHADGGHYYVERWIDDETAMRRFKRICESPFARAGVWARIIVTDGGDFTCMEWQHGKGYTFPPELTRFNPTP